MEFKAKIGTANDFLSIFFSVVTGFILVIITAAVTGEDISGRIFGLSITALIVTAVAIGTIAFMRAKVKYFIVLSEASMTVKFSRFITNNIPYENIISLKTNKFGEIILIYHIENKSKRKHKYHFTTEKQDEFFNLLQTYINKIQT